jgi:hypothetical protein
MCFRLRIWVGWGVHRFRKDRRCASCSRFLSGSEWDKEYVSLKDVFLHLHHVAHLPLVAHFGIAHLAGDIVDIDAFPLSFYLPAVGRHSNKLLAKGAKVWLRDGWFLVGFGLETGLDLLILSGVLLVIVFLLSQALRNHLMIFSNCTKVLPMQYPNSEISTKSQLSLISISTELYLDSATLT